MSGMKKTQQLCWAGRVQIYDILLLIFPFCHAKYRISMAAHLYISGMYVCVSKRDYDDKYMMNDFTRIWVRGYV